MVQKYLKVYNDEKLALFLYNFLGIPSKQDAKSKVLQGGKRKFGVFLESFHVTLSQSRVRKNQGVRSYQVSLPLLPFQVCPDPPFQRIQTLIFLRLHSKTGGAKYKLIGGDIPA